MQGSTLLLTTQYLEEADQLADDIIVIDHGKEIAHGTSDELKSQVGGERIEVSIQQDASIEDAIRDLKPHASSAIHIDDRTRSLVVPISGGDATLTAALGSLDADGVVLRDVGLRSPTLDDVFLALTGHKSDREESNAETQEVDALSNGFASPLPMALSSPGATSSESCASLKCWYSYSSR